MILNASARITLIEELHMQGAEFMVAVAAFVITTCMCSAPLFISFHFSSEYAD